MGFLIYEKRRYRTRNEWGRGFWVGGVDLLYSLHVVCGEYDCTILTRVDCSGGLYFLLVGNMVRQ
jgi:hypothetical protein